MRCPDVREQVDFFEGLDTPVSVQEHLAICPSCRAEVEDRKLLRTGFKALAQEPLPELSVGFVPRLIRQLDNAALNIDPARDFLERAGRRVVFASVVLALTVLVALTAPPSSPWRQSSVTEIYPAPHIQAVDSDLIFGQ